MDAFTFWKLVQYLPAYQGATRVTLRMLDGMTALDDAPQTTASLDAAAAATVPMIAQARGDVREVPAEVLNAMLGGNPVISWGSASPEEPVSDD